MIASLYTKRFLVFQPMAPNAVAILILIALGLIF